MEITKTNKKPIKEWTLEEAKKWCEIHCCAGCPLGEVCGSKINEWNFEIPTLAKLLNLKVGETFHVGCMENPKYFINVFGDIRCVNDPTQYADCSDLCAIIEDPTLIYKD